MCTACKKPLSGQRFTSRDEFAYCLSCFCDLYAKKCAGCTNPISGECPPGPDSRTATCSPSLSHPRDGQDTGLWPPNMFTYQDSGPR